MTKMSDLRLKLILTTPSIKKNRRENQVQLIGEGEATKC